MTETETQRERIMPCCVVIIIDHMPMFCGVSKLKSLQPFWLLVQKLAVDMVILLRWCFLCCISFSTFLNLLRVRISRNSVPGKHNFHYV